jgi:hypothetical protein
MFLVFILFCGVLYGFYVGECSLRLPQRRAETQVRYITVQYIRHIYSTQIREGLGLFCLMPLSAIFQLYCGGPKLEDI